MVDEPILPTGPAALCSVSLERSPCLLRPGAATRLAARMRRLALDRRLAEGADPARSTALAARAAQLAGPRGRNRVAGALERLALTATLPVRPLQVRPTRSAAARNRDQLLELAGALRQPGLLYARGIAILELIVIDGTGPAYTDPSGEGLARQLELAAEALAG